MSYTSKNIKVLRGLDAIRKRPSMYIGSTGLLGLHQIAHEVIDNAVDEHLAGFCSKIKITLFEDDSLETLDNGRGIPVDWHAEENMSALEVVLTKIHSGGKFDNEIYKTSSGLHGVGISATNALSSKLVATIYRDKKIHQQSYERGIPISELKELGPTKLRGTSIFFKPDSKIFTETIFDHQLLLKRIEELAFLNPKLSFEFINEKTNRTHKIQYKNGLTDFISQLNKNKNPLHDIIIIESKIENCIVEVAIQYTDGYSDSIHSFANNINTSEGGTHLNGVKNAIYRYAKDQITKLKLLKATNLEILPKDSLEGITLVVNIKLPNPEFESQTKIKLNNNEIRGPIEDLIYSELIKKGIPNIIFEKLVESVKIRDTAKKSKEISKRKGLFDLSMPGKLSDCSDTNPANCELFIVEGDSAGGSVKQARSRKNQAVLALRGKILNVEKSSLSKMLENEEIRNIISSLGVILKDKSVDISKLRYHKIIIMTDADVDGGHICTLLLTFFFKYLKPLIEAGHIYIAMPPLYKITHLNNTYYFLNDTEFNAWVKSKKNYKVQRFKGLGEMSVEQLEETVINENRSLYQVTIDDLDETIKLFDTLMGNSPDARKNYILNN